MSPTARRIILNLCARQIVQLESKRCELTSDTVNPSTSDGELVSIERQLQFWQDMTTRYQEAQPA